MKILSTLCKALRRESYYWRIGFWSLVVAGTAHLLFIPLLLYLGIPNLALVNVFSVLIYLYSIFVLGLPAIQTKDDRIIGWLVYTELLSHSVIATYYLGVDSGFQYYMYVQVFLPFFMSSYSAGVRLLRLAIVVVASLLVNIYFQIPHANIDLDGEFIHVLGTLNLFAFLVIAGGISFLYIKNSNQYLEKLFYETTVDPMTGLYNRRYLTRLAQALIEKQTAKSEALSLLVIDIDFFKKVNDAYGHDCGDAVIVNTTRIIQDAVRFQCTVARWGGEEFVVLLPQTNKEELNIVAERIGLLIRQSSVTWGNAEVRVTVSIGGATYQDGESFSDLFSRADTALYAVKDSGRDSFIYASPGYTWGKALKGRRNLMPKPGCEMDI